MREQIDCEQREAVFATGQWVVEAGFTDLDGQYGPPHIYTKWIDEAAGVVLEDYRWPAPYFTAQHSAPDTRPCEHRLSRVDAGENDAS